MPRSDLTADGAFGLSDTQLQTLPQALRERVQELQLIVDSIPGFVAVLSTSGQAEMANRGLLEYLGTRCEDLRLGDTSDHVHPDDLPGVVAAWARAASTGTLIEYEHRLRR